jgi:hypothetical protein
VLDNQVQRLQRIARILQESSSALTESQELLLTGYFARRRQPAPRNNFRIALLGKPGTGKSYIVEIIADLEMLVFDAKVVKCAYTGTSADRLKTGTQENEAFTLHGLFGFKVHKRAHEPITKPHVSFNSDRFNRLNDLTTLFVDEVFQVSGKMFNYMQELIKECHVKAQAQAEKKEKRSNKRSNKRGNGNDDDEEEEEKEDDDWANKNVLVSGDPLQTIQFEAGDSIESILLYRALDKYFLLDNKRHAGDKHWMALMNELRNVDLRHAPFMTPEAWYTLANCFCAYHAGAKSSAGVAGVVGAGGACDAVLRDPRTTILVSTNSERR